jgi:hypothetical protein
VVGSQQRDQSTSLQLLGDSPGADGKHAAAADVGRRCTRAEEHHVVADGAAGEEDRGGHWDRGWE